MEPERVLQVEATVPSEDGEKVRLDALFEAAAGVTILFGPSGAGKSTTLSAIAGLLRPSRGRITLSGRVLYDASARTFVPPHQRRIGLVFQSLALFEHMTVLENVAYGIASSDRHARNEKAHAWLERMKVKQLDYRDPRTLSGGEAQRVALARALASEPDALLLDEPFSGLDSPLRRALGEELLRVVSELSIPTLLVTHDRSDALSLGARVVCLEQGRVVATGAPETLLGQGSGSLV